MDGREIKVAFTRFLNRSDLLGIAGYSNRMVGFCHISEELVEEIMSWVPADSLVQLKCVSKSWYVFISALTSNPEFVVKHLRNATNRSSSSSSTSLVFQRYCPCDDNDGRGRYGNTFSLVTLPNYYDCTNDCVRCVAEDLDLPPFCKELNHKQAWWSVACHCDGIICLEQYALNHARKIILCNPALQEFRLLPRSFYHFYDSLGIGFGYDSVVGTYKFVRIFSGHNPKADIEVRILRAEVYTLGTDSWRDMNLPLEGDFVFRNYHAVYWKGRCYWFTRDRAELMILCFDMCNENFHAIPCPNEPERIWKWLVVWNDSISLFSCSANSDSDGDSEIVDPMSFEIRAFDHHSEIEGAKGDCSWTKQINVGPLEGGIGYRFLTFWKNDEFLMKGTHGRLVSYNLHTQKLRSIAINGVDPIGEWVCVFVKSLVSIRRRKALDFK